MRCFVGIDLDENVRFDVAGISALLRSADPRWAAEKWVAAQNLHLTLRFLGEVSPSQADALVAHLRCALSTWDPFDVPCARPAEAIPNTGRARMLWTRYDDPRGDFSALAETVGESAALTGIAPESGDTRFTPHITLVRARSPRPFAASAFSGLPRVRSVSVREVTVFSSVLTRSGPVYERLASLALARV